jgi:hypothetical protein
MSPGEIEELFVQFPDKPIRFTMGSGEQIILQNSSSAIVDSLSLWITEWADLSRRRAKRTRLVSIPNINTAEPLSGMPPDAPRRRRES